MSALLEDAAPLSLDKLPVRLFHRCTQYTSAPLNPTQHLRRHTDTPVVYVGGAGYLWPLAQRQAIARMFPAGWSNPASQSHQTDFDQCKGVVRLLSRRRSVSPIGAAAAATQAVFAEVAERQDEVLTEVTVREQMTRQQSIGARPFVMSDISPHCTEKSSAAFLPIGPGPELFRPFNLLTLTRPSKLAEHDHTLAQLNIAKRGTHTNTHTDWYGADAVGQLLEGEKLWLAAPPECYDDFVDIFPQNQPHFDITSEEARERFNRLDALPLGIAIHQRAGDIISMPSNWPHAVINLTDTTSVGWSYLRAWNLHACIAWAKERGPEESASRVNLDALFDETLVRALPPGQVNPAPERPFYGVSIEVIQQCRNAWHALKRFWHDQRQQQAAAQQAAASSTRAADALQTLSMQ